MLRCRSILRTARMRFAAALPPALPLVVHCCSRTSAPRPPRLPPLLRPLSLLRFAGQGRPRPALHAAGPAHSKEGMPADE